MYKYDMYFNQFMLKLLLDMAWPDENKNIKVTQNPIWGQNEKLSHPTLLLYIDIYHAQLCLLL